MACYNGVVDVGLLLYGAAMGVAIALVASRMGARPLQFRVGNLLNALLYIGVALLLRAAGVPPLVAYLWPLPVVALVWVMQHRARRIA